VGLQRARQQVAEALAAGADAQQVGLDAAEVVLQLAGDQIEVAAREPVDGAASGATAPWNSSTSRSSR
jgi:hypothetical protein